MNRYLSPGQVAKLLSVSPETIRDWTQTRQLGHAKVGNGRTRIRESELEDFLRRRTIEPVAAELRSSAYLGQYLPPSEIAEVLGFSAETVRDWTQSKQLRHVKLGVGRTRIRVADAEDLIRQRTIEPIHVAC